MELRANFALAPSRFTLSAMTIYKDQHVLWIHHPDLLLPGETRMMVDDLVMEFRKREAFIQAQTHREWEELEARSQDVGREALDALLSLTKPL